MGIIEGKLDNQEIRKKLESYKYSSSVIDSIIEQFWFHDFYNSFVSDEVYLKHLLDYLDKNKPKAFNRYDSYRYFFDTIVKIKAVRFALQQVALVFEKIQSDAVPPQKFIEILEGVNPPTRIRYALPTWVEKSHLARVRERDNQTLFIWGHHTITEFLTAEYLLEQKNPIAEFEKLAILNQEGIIAFKPSWSGVLRFLLESSRGKETLGWLVGFLEKHADNIDDNLSELLTLVDVVLTPSLQKRIFHLIYDSYFERVVWLPVWTRTRLSKFVDAEIYKRLKRDIKKWPSRTETFVKRGNVVTIIEGLLERKGRILTDKEKDFWQKTLINFANNPDDGGNGVLQRDSLSAIALFNDEKIIPLVADSCFEKAQDSLVRDEFIQFCYNSAPNSKAAIDYFIKGIKKGSTIYARHGLYKITTREATEYFLSEISQDEQFLKAFLEHESIFDEEGADKELIKTIEKQINPKITRDLKKIIFTVLRIDAYYKEDQSNFLHQIVQIISKHDPKYLFEVLGDIKKEKDEQKIDRLFYDSKELLAPLLTKDNIKQYLKVLKEFPERTRRDAQFPVYIAKRVNGEIGEQVYQEAVRLGYIEKVDESRSERDFEEQQNKRKQDTIQDFQRLLEPSPGKYIPSVFKNYLNNKKELDEFFKTKEGTKLKKRLIKLVVDEGIRKIDPRQFRVKIENRYEGNSKFTWSSQASFYGDILKIVKEIAPKEIAKNRQRIIDFIPYEFDTGSISDFVERLENEELEWVNKVMSDKEDDRRYLIPQTYIYLVGEYAKRGCKLLSVKPILKSFVGDPRTRDYDQRSALESLIHFINELDKDTKAFLQETFDKSKDKELANIANSLLIAIYKDDKAIGWRFDQIKTPLKFDRGRIEGVAHSVGPEEEELDSLAFAKPLLALKDEKYLKNFLDLLDYSFKVLREKKTELEKKEYWGYINYLWRIAIAFVENLKENGSFKPLLALEEWTLKHSSYENSNWLMARIRELKKTYIDYIGMFEI